MDFLSYHKAVHYLDGLVNIQSGPNYMDGEHPDPTIYLKRMQWFLDLIGNPEKGFKFIHVTGTSGKGTVANMIHNSLMASGQVSGLFTSPFVTTSIEKIQVGNLYISPDDFADLVFFLKPYFDEAFQKCPWGGPSYFERFLAIAFLYFKKMKCEWVVLEVGCGGRYDATNIIKNPVFCVVTNIDYDHTHILGKTLKKIARDKSGIIKKGSKCFTTEKRPALLKIIKDECHSVGAEFHHVNGGNVELVDAMGFNSEEICLPARFEIIREKPMIIIDGAHNRSKIRYTLDKIKTLKYKKLHVVMAIAANKNRQDTVEPILNVADYFYATRFQSADRKCMNPAELNPGGKIFTDSQDALNEALSKAGEDDVILVTGSFYLAGEIRKRWYSEEFVLKKRRAF